MREDDDAGALRLRDVVRVRARVRVRVASQPEVLAEPVAAPGEFLQRDRLRFGFFRFATGGGAASAAASAGGAGAAPSLLVRRQRLDHVELVQFVLLLLLFLFLTRTVRFLSRSSRSLAV